MPTTLTNLTTKLAIRSILSIVSILAVMSAHAQTPYQQNGSRDYNQGPSNYITVFEHCDFGGKSRALDIGEYNNVRTLNIRNDSISSLQIPRGLQVVLHEDEHFRGDSTIISGDVGCLNRSWNDKTSSLRVIKTASQPTAGRYDPLNRGPRDRRNDNYRLNITNLTQGVTRVEIDGGTFTKGRRNGWVLNSVNGNVDNYREESRDNRSINLKNKRSPQRVQLDLLDNSALFIAGNGRTVNYRVIAASKGNARNPVSNRRDHRKTHPSSGIIRNRCINYRAYTRGGEGGIRFTGRDGFFRFDKKAKTGRLCHDGELRLELSKTNPNTEVLLSIEGKTYVFGRNEQHDELLNEWYRKRFIFKRR